MRDKKKGKDKMKRKSKYNYKVESKLQCFKCGSNNIKYLYQNLNTTLAKLNLYTGKIENVDTENYLIHKDCYICMDCKKYDFPDPDLWQRNTLISGHKCNCGNTRFRISYNDIFSDEFEVECLECKEKYILPKEPCDEY